MIGEVVIVLVVCYLPFFNDFLNTARPRWYHFVLPALFGSSILLFDELRKLTVRKWPNGLLAFFAW